MNVITANIRPMLTMLALLTLLFGFAYPLTSTLLVSSIFYDKAEGSLIKNKDGEVLGSKLIGQQFSKPQYFWGRLSAANYNASASAGSNLGAANPALLDAVKARIEALKAVDPDNGDPIPVDLVTASASGLDPEISLAAAAYQVARVAKARGMPEEKIREILQKFTYNRQFEIFGEPRVNVLELNLALDGKI